jgi:hypothetical protein
MTTEDHMPKIQPEQTVDLTVSMPIGLMAAIYTIASDTRRSPAEVIVDSVRSAIAPQVRRAPADYDAATDLLAAWPRGYWTARDLLRRISEDYRTNPDSLRLLKAIGKLTKVGVGKWPTVRQLGLAFRRIRNRWCDDIRLVGVPGSNGSMMWGIDRR